MTTLETVTSIENWLPNREVERDNRMQDFIKRIVPDGTISLRLYHSKSNVCLASYPVDRKISSIIEDAVEKHDDGLWEKGLYEIHAVDKTGTLYLEHFVVESFKNFAPPASPSDIANNDEPSDAEKLKFYEFHGAHLCDLENRNQELAEANDRLLAEIIKVRSDAEKDLKAEKEKQSVDLLKSNLIKSRCQMLEKQIKQLENELKGARCNQQLVQAPEGQKIWSKSTGLGPYTIIRAGITQELRLPDSQKPKQIEAYLCKSRAGANKVVPITDATMEPQAWGNLFYFLNLILYWVSFKKLR